MGHYSLVVMFLVFTGIILWVVFGRSKSYRDSANIIFRHEDSPDGAPDRDKAADGKENGK
ncbi:MAG: cbb3-type cytochrome c oxidase subunit 3 [Rhodobacteraceae bacterium]|nr:cbb3-type cytochrome c oxidase subunit 3 [Paracoccaceae bacterium]